MFLFALVHNIIYIYRLYNIIYINCLHNKIYIHCLHNIIYIHLNHRRRIARGVEDYQQISS